MSTVIRYLNHRTGQPATHEDELAGLAHYIECDHLGVPLRNASGQCVAYSGPETLSHAERVEAVETIRYADPKNSTQSRGYSAPNPKDTAAIRDYLAAKYGANVAGPEGQAAQHPAHGRSRPALEHPQVGRAIRQARQEQDRAARRTRHWGIRSQAAQ